MPLLSLVHTYPVTMGDLLRGLVEDETPDIFDDMASYEEWVSFDQQKDQGPNSSSAQADEHRV
eukprot:10051940-Prorocentrum_lima.AAC.1